MVGSPGANATISEDGSWPSYWSTLRYDKPTVHLPTSFIDSRNEGSQRSTIPIGEWMGRLIPACIN
jgi:hypothetical protein